MKNGYAKLISKLVLNQMTYKIYKQIWDTGRQKPRSHCRRPFWPYLVLHLIRGVPLPVKTSSNPSVLNRLYPPRLSSRLDQFLVLVESEKKSKVL